MFEWSEELQMVRDAVRTFVDNEIRPHREELEHGDLPPYDLLRKLYKTFGMDQMAADSFDKRIAAEEAQRERSAGARERASAAAAAAAGSRCCRSSSSASARRAWSPRWACRSGSPSAAIMSKGTIAQKKRWARDILTMDKIGAWAITEPNSGSDAFGSMAVDRAPRRRRVRAQRLEDVHHQRPVRRHDRVHLQARRGQPARRAQGRAVRARHRHARPRAVEAAAQDGPALVADRACCSSTTCASAATACSARAKRRSAAARAARRRRRRS